MGERPHELLPWRGALVAGEVERHALRRKAGRKATPSARPRLAHLAAATAALIAAKSTWVFGTSASHA
jgi:hypothetical protein